MVAVVVERVVVDPKVLRGKPVIKGTRIPVYLILELLAAGMSIKDILREYPELREEDVRAALDYASKLLKQEIVLPLEA
ncbi:MAG: antitoxin [Thermoprotei archaeon]|nr:MAG: antitoxin [Thermoprotei archaeon]RLF01240.1 MAG: antitoxin [Thermoprotei archaeon]